MKDEELQRQQEIQAGKTGMDAENKEEFSADDEPDFVEAVAEIPADEPEVGDVNVTEQTPVPNRTLMRKPYRVEGGEVLDADGDRVASAGYNSNRKTTGPAIALLIAEALNRY